MNIAIVQARPLKGQVTENIIRHLKWIKRAIELDAQMVMFPELSITGYEPELAESLACSAKDSIFDPFQRIADEAGITISVGMPTRSAAGIHISMIIFRPKPLERMVYSKGILHPDELPYFTPSEEQPCLEVGGCRIAVGICYETLQRSHFLKALREGAEVYLASVAKPERATDQAYIHFPSIAKEFETPILMANAIGPSDDFISNGRSSVWDRKGQLLAQLDDKTEGMIIYDTSAETASVVKFH